MSLTRNKENSGRANKENSGTVQAAIIGGVFAVVASIIGGIFLITNTIVENKVNRTSNPSFSPTSIVSVPQAPTQDSSSIIISPTSTFEIIINSPTITPEPIITVKAEDVMPYVKGEDEGVKNVASWWREIEPSDVDGILTPSTFPNHQCFGLAWNTNEYGYRVLVVFQEATALTFRDGGWRTTICVPNNVIISPEDIGKIQADWLGKRYVDVGAQPWSVVVK